MGCSSFKAETKILINGRAYILKKKIDDDLWHLQDPKDLNLKEFSEVHLQLYHTMLISLDHRHPLKTVSY